MNHTLQSVRKILLRVSVTKYGVWIGESIYWIVPSRSASNYNTVTDFHTTNHATLIFLVVTTISSYPHKTTVTITHEITSSTFVNTSTIQLPTEFSSTECSSSELTTELSWIRPRIFWNIL
jgi:hypothetical protein